MLNCYTLFTFTLLTTVKILKKRPQTNGELICCPVVDDLLTGLLCDVSDRTVEGLRGGISTDAFERFLMNLMKDWKIIDVYRQRAAEAIEFQYTYWPDPDNRTARGQEFINVGITLFWTKTSQQTCEISCLNTDIVVITGFQWKAYATYLVRRLWDSDANLVFSLHTVATISLSKTPLR